MGSGFKDFAPGDILTAADVDGYLMRQTVMTFASASARDTALSGVLDEGMVAYLEDSNYFTVYDGSAWQVFSNTPAYELVTFTSSGTFTKASYPWGKSVRVRVVGGGGGSAGIGTTGAGEVSLSGGGGGGGYSEVRLAMSALSASETVTVGAGGSAGASTPANGGNGGTSSFGSHCSATGGDGGGFLNAATPPSMALSGAGGVGSGGDINIAGDGGTMGITLGTAAIAQSFGGAGGGTALAGSTDTPRANESTPAGQLYGGGAAGGCNTPSVAGKAGTAGAAGVVIVEVFG